MIPGIESLACGPLAVPVEVMEHVVRVESALNPYAIGVVGGRLVRQPRNLAEAVATVQMLESRQRNYSVGLAQVNRYNLGRFGLDSPEKAFDQCPNLRAGASILAECLQRFEGRWGDAFSCYYSGNASTGYEHGYVDKVMASMTASATPGRPSGASPVEPIPLAASDGRGVAQGSPSAALPDAARRRVVGAATSRFEPLESDRPFAVVAAEVDQADAIASRTADVPPAGVMATDAPQARMAGDRPSAGRSDAASHQSIASASASRPIAQARPSSSTVSITEAAPPIAAEVAGADSQDARPAPSLDPASQENTKPTAGDAARVF